MLAMRVSRFLPVGDGDEWAMYTGALTACTCPVPPNLKMSSCLVPSIHSLQVAQSVIPGILQSDHTFKLVYGAVEPSHKLTADPDMHKMLAAIAPKLCIAERSVPAVPLPAKATAEVRQRRQHPLRKADRPH